MVVVVLMTHFDYLTREEGEGSQTAGAGAEEDSAGAEEDLQCSVATLKTGSTMAAPTAPVAARKEGYRKALSPAASAAARHPPPRGLRFLPRFAAGPPAPATKPGPRPRSHAVNVQAILRTLIAQKLGMVRQYKVMVAEVVSVLLVEGVHMMVVAVATGARVRVVLRENIIHPCCV